MTTYKHRLHLSTHLSRPSLTCVPYLHPQSSRPSLSSITLTSCDFISVPHYLVVMFNFCESRNLYKVLDIDATATAASMRRAFCTAALRTHPDKGGSNAAFHAVNIAFEVLSCPASRAVYDRWLNQHCFPSSNTGVCTNIQKNCDCPNGSAHQTDGDQQPAKRRRSTGWPLVSKKAPRKKSRLDAALGLVRSALQSMSTLQRQVAILGMRPQVRTELLGYMERARQDTGTLCDVDADVESFDLRQGSPDCKPNLTTRSASTYVIGKVYSGIGVERIKYQANIHVKALRMYAREQSTVEMAIEHQIILVQMKQALTSRSIAEKRFWDDPRKALQVCKDVLHANGTSEAELGLRAWVHIRASRWLGPRCRIGSMATTLAIALDVHARLLRARAASWDVLRAEWVRLIRARKHITLREAEAIVDRSRHDTLQEHLTRAMVTVDRMLEQKGQRAAASSVKGRAKSAGRGHIKRSYVQSSAASRG